MLRPFRALLFANFTVLAATGSTSGYRSAIAQDVPGTPMAADGALSVMTYNVKGLPWPLATGREEALDEIAARLAGLRHAGRQPRIVLIQEAFTPQAAEIARRAGYAHVAAGPDADDPAAATANRDDVAYLNRARWDRGERMGKQLGSGLLILSDYPIVRVDRMAYPEFACAGFDCLANKGALIAHLKVPGVRQRVSVVNTHLNARKAAGVPVGRSQRAFGRQAELLAAFIAGHVPAGQPMIVGGDMNIGKDPKRGAAFFSSFARAGLGFVRPHLGGARVALAQAACADAVARLDLQATSRRGKDWLFARDARHAPMPLVGAQVPFGSEPDGSALSDHFGYAISYAPAELGAGETFRVAEVRTRPGPA